MSVVLSLSLVVASAAAEPITVTAAPGHGVTVEAADGSWNVNARARLQVRAEAELDPRKTGAEMIAAAFLVRRARLAFEGDLFHELLSWDLQLGMAPNDVEADLPIVVRDANVTWHAPAGFDVKLGQMKVPFDRQRITSSSKLQFPDRTRVMNELTLDRDIGVIVENAAVGEGVLVGQLALFGGDGRNRPRRSPGMLYVARVQVSPFGKFDDKVEGDLKREDRLRVAVAAAAGYNDRTSRPGSTLGKVFVDDEGEGFLDYAHGTADVLVKWGGASLLAEGLVRAATTDRGAPEAIARSGYGGFVQAGWMLTDVVEVAARTGLLAPLDMTAWGGPANDPALVRELETGACASFYMLGHDVKAQMDGAGIFKEDGTAEAVGRLQVQVFF